MDINNLKNLPREDLVKLAAQYGVPVHHKAKPEKIIRDIGEAISTQAKPKVAEAKPEAPKKVVVIQTEDDVRASINHVLAKEGYLIKFNGDDTVTFRYKGAEECIHLSSSPLKIKRVAEDVAKGARRIMALTQEFDATNPNAVSQYTKTVLSV